MRVNFIEIRLFILGLILSISLTANSQCPDTNSVGMFDPATDILMTTYHASIVKVIGGLVCWGEDLMPDGTSISTG